MDINFTQVDTSSPTFITSDIPEKGNQEFADFTNVRETQKPKKIGFTSKLTNFKIGGKRKCKPYCFYLHRQELIDQYNLTKNNLANKLIAKKPPKFHKCVHLLTDARGYSRAKTFFKLRSILNKDAKDILIALSKYEHDHQPINESNRGD